MNKDIIETQIYQSDFNDEIRRLCRSAIANYGGIRKFSITIGEAESLWQNRLTDGRVVGFDVSWFIKVLLVTGDYKLLVPFFKRGRKVSISSIAKLCERLNHVVLPVFKCHEPPNDDTTYLHIDNLLKVASRLIQERGK